MTTIHDIVRRYEATNPEGHYFDAKTLRSFGQELSWFHVRKVEGSTDAYDLIARSTQVFGSDRRRHYDGTPRQAFDVFSNIPVDCVTRARFYWDTGEIIDCSVRNETWSENAPNIPNQVGAS